MKAAIFSDVHGNTIALDAVLADVAAEGVDECWVVGDFVAFGPDPVGAATRLSALPNARFVRGNSDRYTLTGDLPLPDDSLTPDQVRGLIGLARSSAWTLGAICGAGFHDWLAGVPLEERVALPDGTRVLLVHASPGRDDGRGIAEDMTGDDLATAIAGCDADLVFVGHTHEPLDRTVDGVTLHNLGSVSLPDTDDHRAMWTLLTANESGYMLARRYVNYDIERVKAAFDAMHHPAAKELQARFPAS